MNIPLDIWLDILSFLQLPELCQASQVCRQWKAIAEPELQQRIEEGISSSEGQIRIDVSEFKYPTTRWGCPCGHGRERILPSQTSWLTKTRMESNCPTEYGIREVHSFNKISESQLLLGHPHGIESLWLSFPDIRGKVRFQESFFFHCQYEPVISSPAPDPYQWEFSLNGMYGKFRESFSPMRLVKVCVSSCLTMHPDCTVLCWDPRSTNIPWGQTYHKVANMIIRPTRNGYWYKANLRPNRPPDYWFRDPDWIPYCYSVSGWEVFFEDSVS